MSIEVGFFGKLPSHGDFLRRRLSDDFVRTWDDWLEECLAELERLVERADDLGIVAKLQAMVEEPHRIGTEAVLEDTLH